MLIAEKHPDQIVIPKGPKAVPQKMRVPLGQILVENGDITADEKLNALAEQSKVQARLGEILVANGIVKPSRLLAAISQQFDAEIADFLVHPPDTALFETVGAEQCLDRDILPWRRAGNVTIVATSRPELFDSLQPDLEQKFGAVKMAVTSARDLHQAVLSKRPITLATRAETRVADEESCRGWASTRRSIVTPLVLLALLIITISAPTSVFLVLLFWTIFMLVAQVALQIAAAIAQVRANRASPDTEKRLKFSRLPTVSILVPLYREPKIANRLIARLAKLDYPSELLDICLIVEADDPVTADAIASVDLPKTMRQILVPESQLKTKPRALNYALDFCRGSIIGVYDAEDAPDPAQIRQVAEQFHHAPADVVCLQGVLDYYNAHENWLSRCFTIEYAAWFRLILPGLLRLGLVIPLGGTTLFFRREILEKIGGWDAHNVTEDADLGIRLARHGYRAEFLQSVTTEEANCNVWPWIKQRSRWLKGYAVTWVVHTRRPARLWSDLGPMRFLGVQLLLLGTLTQFAVAPVLWSFWLIMFGFGHPVHDVLSTPMIWTLAILFIFAELTGIAMRFHAVRQTNHKGLARWTPTLFFYFPLATLASYKAAFEVVTKPFYWDKTEHGRSEPKRQEPAPTPNPAFRSRRHRF